jgi:Ca2+/Na+ antiporter
MFVLVLLCCVVLCVIRAIRQTDKQKKRGKKEIKRERKKEKKKKVSKVRAMGWTTEVRFPKGTGFFLFTTIGLSSSVLGSTDPPFLLVPR